MAQQINLFNPLFLKRKKYFSVATMAQALAVLLAGLGVFYAYIVMQDVKLTRQMEESTRAYDAQKERFVRITAELAPGKAETRLDQELKQAQAAIAARQNLLREIQVGAVATSPRYSEYLRAFARQAIDGLWLTEIQIGGPGRELSLSGRALRADLLPAYIQRLNAEPIMRGRPVLSLAISRPEPKPSAAPGAAPAVPLGLEFRLTSAAEIASSAPATPPGAAAAKAN